MLSFQIKISLNSYLKEKECKLFLISEEDYSLLKCQDLFQPELLSNAELIIKNMNKNLEVVKESSQFIRPKLEKTSIKIITKD